MLITLSCQLKQIGKKGKIDNWKQNHKCRECRRQFAKNRKQKILILHMSG